MIRLIRMTIAAAVLVWASHGIAQSDAASAGKGDAAGSLLLVYHGPAMPSDAVSATRDALAQLAAERGGSFVDMSPKLPAPPGAAEPLGQGMDAYHAFEHERALQLLDAALADAERTGAADLSTAQLSDLFIYRGLVLTQLGRPAEAWDALVHAATLDPTRKLDPVRYPPRVIETFARALAAVAAGDTAELTIAAAPECRVTLNSAPVAAGQVVPVPYGRHFVRAICPGSQPGGGLVSAQRPKQTVAPGVAAALPPADEEIARLARSRGYESAVTAFVHVHGQDTPILTARRLDPRTARTQARATALVQADTAASEARRAAIAVLATAPALSGAVVTKPALARPTPWYRRPWVWALCGAAAATAVLVPFALGSSSDSGFVVRPSGDLPP